MQRPPNGWPFVLLLSKALEDEWSSTGDDRSVSRKACRPVVLLSAFEGIFAYRQGSVRLILPASLGTLNAFAGALVSAPDHAFIPCRALPMSSPVSNHGFTLIELMVTVAILATLVAIALPNFSSTISSTKSQTVVQELATALNLARSEAVMRHGGVQICPRNTAGTGCDAEASWQSGWLVMAGDTMLRAWDAPSGVSIETNLSAVSFDGRGGTDLTDPATLQVSGGASAQASCLRLAQVGRVSVSRGNCS